MLRKDKLPFAKNISTSDFAGKYYTNKLSSPEKIDVVYQSVEANPPKRTEPNQNFTIGMLGNFEPNKGQHIAIEALREVVKKYPDTRLLLIGGNNSRYAQELEKRITEYNLRQNISIVAHTVHPHDYLIQADAALVCSGFECFGRVIVEGLKCGLPVIVPDKPFGQELIKEGYNGFLYNRESSGDLAQKIILLRQTGHLPEMNKRFEIGRKPLLHTNIRRGIYLYHQFEKSMSEKQAIIVIPVYTTQLTLSEHAALRQCFDILSSYPKCFVKPESLDITSLVRDYPANPIVL